MLGLLKRFLAPVDAADLGRDTVALALRCGATPPAGCTSLVVDAGGHTRRPAPGKRIDLRAGEQAWAWHPGPYAADLRPYAAAPEIGLRVRFIVDGDEDGARRRFELMLAAEADRRLDLAGLAVALESALRRELIDGGLDLPPCTTIEEWNAFRQGFNQLLYMRFGLAVEDCVPVDLGGTHDYAAELAMRAACDGGRQADAVRIEPALADGGLSAPAPAAPAAPAPAAPAAPAISHIAASPSGRDGATPDPAIADARALRRLFLELPGLMCGLRRTAPPCAQALFHRQQGLLQRFDLLCAGVVTMPALALAAPGRPLAAVEQARRGLHSTRACESLDEAWALLARCSRADADALAGLYDEAERIVANLEADCAARRATGLEEIAA